MGVLDGKATLVMGASKGIGAGIAKGFAAAGASVVVNYASSKEGADRVVSDIAERGGTAIAAQGDVSKSGDVKQLFEDVAGEFGGLDVLVNNAGVYSFGPLESVTETEFHRQYNTNVLGTLLATREAVKLFGEKGGSIINIGTAGTRNPGPAMVLYLSPKARST
jgi:3-oxoacyl-[acyl-carrier protein] reductase